MNSLPSLEYKTRFLSKFVPDPNSGCWIWIGGYFSTGYGVFHIKRKPHGAHRISYIIFNGEIPIGKQICHKCDVRECVNPRHLFAGTALENRADCLNKMRHARGQSHGMASLTQDEVASIFNSQIASAYLAARYGVSRSSVNRIKSGAAWSSATGKVHKKDLRQNRFTIADANLIRSEHSAGLSYSVLADKYKCTKQNIYSIVKNKTHKDFTNFNGGDR